MTIVITGASRGIGKAIALAFAATGANLYLSSKNPSTLDATAEEIRKTFPNCRVNVYAADLSQRVEAIGFGNWVLQQTSAIDVLVNNAGHFAPGQVTTEAPGILESQIATNLYSAYYLTQTLVPSMKARQQGHIFNICSIASLQAYDNGGSYSISKFALMGFHKNLRKELMPHSIKVTALYPGAVLTDAWGGFDNSDQRIMEAEDIAKLVLASAQLSPAACVEDIVIRPVLGDL